MNKSEEGTCWLRCLFYEDVESIITLGFKTREDLCLHPVLAQKGVSKNERREKLWNCIQG